MRLENTTIRALRRLLNEALALLPDPDSPRHGWVGGERRSLCGKGRSSSQLTDVPEEVTCKACRQTEQWEAWAWCRDHETDDGGW